MPDNIYAPLSISAVCYSQKRLIPRIVLKFKANASVPPRGIYREYNQKAIISERNHEWCPYRFRSKSSGERRCRPVVLRTASTPRHTTVDTDEASSRSDVPGLSRDSSSVKPASTSPMGWLFEDLEVGTGRDAEGEVLRVSAACVCTSSSPIEIRGERVGDADCSRSCRQLNDRTTSPLQMGQVLRRVTSQGVLHTSDSV